jgi:NAD(P)-dependent dehydrogenase (short-subunit alcohol dehydrogenase family)
VVGAGSGMGRATAALLHREGARVVMSGRSRSGLEDSAGSFAETRNRLCLVPADITEPDDRDRLLASVDRVDHLVVTAADLVYLPVESCTEQAMDKALRSKIVGPFFLAQLAAKRMSPTGSITFVSGVAAERPLPTGTVDGHGQRCTECLGPRSRRSTRPGPG